MEIWIIRISVIALCLYCAFEAIVDLVIVFHRGTRNYVCLIIEEQGLSKYIRNESMHAFIRHLAIAFFSAVLAFSTIALTKNEDGKIQVEFVNKTTNHD